MMDKTSKPKEWHSDADKDLPDWTPFETREGILEIYAWDEVYRMNLHLIYGEISDDQFNRWLKRKNFSNETITIRRDQAASVKRIASIKDNSIIALVILIPHKWKKTPEHLLTLSHEMLHCTSTILRRVGIQLTEDTEEAFCYHHEMLCRLFGQALGKKPVPYKVSVD